MGEASLAIQIALRARLLATPAVIALVPATNVLDRNARPNPTPSIILGEDQVVDSGTTIKRDVVRVYSTLHIWCDEDGLQQSKTIAGAIRRALARRLDLADAEFFCADCNVENTRYLRDPDGKTSHGIMTINSLVQERWRATI